MPTPRASIDTGALLALASPRDQYHERAVRIARTHLANGGRWVGSVLVLSELHGHLLRWREPRTAHRVLDAVRRDTAYQWVGVDDELIDAATTNWLLRFADHKLSLSDAVTCELMAREGIDHVFGFDQDFVMAGFALQE
jgi:predicted nucleic acid-binding protein